MNRSSKLRPADGANFTTDRLKIILSPKGATAHTQKKGSILLLIMETEPVSKSVRTNQNISGASFGH